jgi:hypothetical protein
MSADATLFVMNAAVAVAIGAALLAVYSDERDD